ncbi:hypothetical protein JCM6882_002615 [Rhodosporidiobolus microsporus]
MNAEEGSRSAFSSLPLDIYDLLVEAVTLLPPVVSTATLLSLCRVSRAWCAAAQPALFRMPFLPFGSPDTTPPRTYSRLQSLLETLHRRPDLAALVRSFDLGRYTARCIAEVKVDRRLVSPLSIELVKACPNLREATVPFVVQAEKGSLVEALQRLSVLESFSLGEGVSIVDPWVVNVDIAVKDSWGTAVFTRRDLAALAQSWPLLRRFILQARVRGLDADEVIPWELESFELSLLKNFKLSFPYLDKLLSNCRTTSSLRRLIVREHQLHPTDLVQLVEAYGDSLEVVETFTANRFAPNEPLLAAIAASCPNLRRLRLGTPLYDLPSALHHLSQLPKLRWIALDTVLCNPRGEEATSTGVAEQVRAFPALRYLSFAPGCHVETEADVERFRRFEWQLRELREELAGEIEVVLYPQFT